MTENRSVFAGYGTIDKETKGAVHFVGTDQLNPSRRNTNITISPHVKESGFRNPGNFCFWNPESWKFLLVESGILCLGIRNTGVGIGNPTNNPNPESKFN